MFMIFTELWRRKLVSQCAAITVSQRDTTTIIIIITTSSTTFNPLCHARMASVLVKYVSK